MDSPDSLAVAGNGECFGHFVVPFGEIRQNIDLIRDALSKAEERWLKSEGRPLSVESGFTCVTGQCDLLLRIRLDDLRFVSDFQSRLLGFGALPAGAPSPTRLQSPTIQSSAWVFAVPYRLGEEKGGRVSESRDSVRFVVYLRVRRSVYKAFGRRVESAIVKATRRIFTPEKKIYARVQYSLGWPDLIVEGFFDCDPQVFLLAVVSLQKLHFGDSKRTKAFRKTLSLVGYKWEFLSSTGTKRRKKPTKSRPIIFARAATGSLRIVSEVLPKLLDGGKRKRPPGYRAHLLDGKWDMVFVPNPNSRAIRFEELYQAYSDPELNDHLERSQTHLLFCEAQDFFERRERDLGDLDLGLEDSDSELEATCSCRAHSGMIQTTAEKLQDLELEEILPRTLKATASNLLGVLRYALHDRTNCCDSQIAITACVRGLNLLLDHIREIGDQLKRCHRSQQDQFFRFLETFWNYLESWCVLGGRVLRERTAGSFEDLFNQSVSVSSYRGGVPKLLFVADHLVHTFFSRCQLALSDGSHPEPYLSTLYEPCTGIQSEPVSGIIKIPLRYAFVLHLVLPQLFHEVGQHLFHLAYPAYSQEFEKRFRVLRDALEKGRRESSGEDVKYEKAFRDIMEDVGDLYADLIVLFFGFRGKFGDFVHYLTTFYFDALKHHAAPSATRTKQFVYLIQRLCFACQFHTLQPYTNQSRDRSAEAQKDVLESLLDEKLNTYIEGPDRATDEIVDLVFEKIREIRELPRYKEFELSEIEDARAIAKLNVRGDVHRKFYLPFLRDLLVQLASSNPVEEPDRTPEKFWDGIERGEVISFRDSSEVLEAYFHLYRLNVTDLVSLRSGESAEPRFREMAALHRSATLFFHQN